MIYSCNYLKNIWELRYFWVHLALSDLRARWRRSFLGILWSVIQPLGMALLLSFVLGRIFNTNIINYIPYILSGIIIWEFVISCVVSGSLSFIQAAPYIKQCKHPLAIYTLRTSLSNIALLMLATIPLICWALAVMPQNFGVAWIAILSIYPILILISWPVATTLAYIGSRFRDLTPALSLIMQAIWFISPVYFEEKMFRSGGLGWLIDYNPIYHLLEIIRAPLLKGLFPTYQNYFFCFITIVAVTVIAVIVGMKSERKVIYYL